MGHKVPSGLGILLMPSTKRTLISERAEFDEQIFPLSKLAPSTPLQLGSTPTQSPALPSYRPVQLPEIGGDPEPSQRDVLS